MPENQKSAFVPGSQPWVSVIILNWHGAGWIERCMESLRQQTIFDRSQIIFADNQSKDGWAVLSRWWLRV